MPQTLTRILVHIIFSTKHREDTIASDIEAELHRYMGGICRNCESPLLTSGGTANHVHLLVSQSKNIALSELVMNVKKDSSKWIKTKGSRFRSFHWQDAYGAFSIGESGVAALKTYIANQKAHHARRSFQTEFLAFLRKYRVPYDERYIWD